MLRNEIDTFLSQMQSGVSRPDRETDELAASFGRPFSFATEPSVARQPVS